MKIKKSQPKPSSISLPCLAAKGDTNRVVQLITGGAAIDERDDVGNTALIVAAGNGNGELVNFLIEKGANVDAVTRKNVSSARGGTALIYAVREGHHEIIKRLVEAGANVNAETTWRESPLYEAIQREDMKMIKFLIKKGAKSIVILPFMAVKNHRADILKMLLDAGADANCVHPKSRESLLSEAVRCGNDISFVAPLLEKGARPNELSGMRHPFNYAAWNGNEEICKMLLAHGADVNRQDKLMRAPLMDAAFMGRTGVVKLLLAQGADIRLHDKEGKTAWDLAKENSHQKLLPLLDFD